ncbi:MAG: GTPase ObgE [SAR324 cluster bacterium]|nr:GTPase ObgE [SAR324 cluster bacterium]
MKFVDSVKIHVRSGKGGPGCTAFRREKYVPMGGPNGGDGGKGGDVWFVGDPDKTTLLDLSFQQHQHAESGMAGGGQDRHGRAGHELHIPVPLGTVVMDEDSREVLLEVVDEKPYHFLEGGRGGRGNARFKSSTNRAPDYHQPGEEGTELWVRLELKLMADIGLVGFPNAGKSTLISSVSHARPKIADYPFTTLVPNLGVVKHSDHDPFVIADIPGIIEGAHEGRGLGDRFLRHIERTALLLLLLDVSGFSEQEPWQEYETLLHELSEFSANLPGKPRRIALTKLDAAVEDEDLDALQKRLEGQGERVFRISAVSGRGLPELTRELAQAVELERERRQQEVPEPATETVPVWEDWE